MLQAIVTKLLGPTTHMGTRISARCNAGHLVVRYDYALDIDENHKAAAQALVERLGWTEAKGYPALVGGALPGNAGYCFVMSWEG
jgi:hypothetical protein